MKTRQHLITTTQEKSKGTCHFTLTENEQKCADFLIGYWIEKNDYFIVPVKVLAKARNGLTNKGDVKYVYKHIVTWLKKPVDKGPYSAESMQYRNAWHLIEDFINKKRSE